MIVAAGITRMLVEQQRRIEKERSVLAVLVNESRAAGATWEQIGKALGVSKQAAQQRYG